MAYQKAFWKGQSMRTNGREDRIRGNPEAPPMHDGPGPSDEDDMTGADRPNRGTSQPTTRGNKKPDEFPLKSAGKKPHSSQRRQVLMAHVLRMADDGTSTAAIGGGAGSAAGGGT